MINLDLDLAIRIRTWVSDPKYEIRRIIWVLDPWLNHKNFCMVENPKIRSQIYILYLQISVIIWIFLKNINDNFRNFSWQFVITIFVKIIIWLWT